ncbi:hypothetical protein SAY87_000040 [Trapa incisa]|uniref:PPIase cyclophilin-type domain-containing protein n=1 Tax=Trapa incisa TaxID=236973 RepID=A0AAN7GHZ4_9MYRT|nr:hypothetical protein SAY87_000040 [Trapa incisa]
MARKQTDAEPARCAPLILFFLGLISFALAYTLLSTILASRAGSPSSNHDSSGSVGLKGADGEDSIDACCQGIENLELWGAAVKWGSDHKFNSSKECCRACKAMCSGNDGPCLCDTWVFCGNRNACGSKFGECWLKKQKDPMAPDRQEGGQTQSWTSGLIFGKGVGVIGLETEYGTLHIKLLPECSSRSVFYILELLSLRHCAGCHFYRAEGRGELWDANGNHVENAPLGPPFALIQGTFEAQGTKFNKIPTEACPTIRRGTVAWVGSGPEFFISLANHVEWKKVYTVFGSVIPEDMGIVEKIAQLPTRADVWNNINVTVLEKPVPLMLRQANLKAAVE